MSIEPGLTQGTEPIFLEDTESSTISDTEPKAIEDLLTTQKQGTEDFFQVTTFLNTDNVLMYWKFRSNYNSDRT